MKFLEIVEKMQNENLGSIVLVQNGIFFVGVGKDAVTLNEMLGLKVTCMRPNLCKVGFLVKGVEKYIKLLEEKGKSFVLYSRVADDTFEEIYRFKGESINETRVSFDCENCKCKKETDEDVLKRVIALGKH